MKKKLKNNDNRYNLTLKKVFIGDIEVSIEDAKEIMSRRIYNAIYDSEGHIKITDVVKSDYEIELLATKYNSKADQKLLVDKDKNKRKKKKS